MPNIEQKQHTAVKYEFQTGENFAKLLDEADPLRKFRSRFLIPPPRAAKTIGMPPGELPQAAGTAGEEKKSTTSAASSQCIYLAGNSLGLQPIQAREYIDQELQDWASFGVEGHFDAKLPWLPYHENLTDLMAHVVGAEPVEVVVMNTLTVNLHLMMVSFYRPTKSKYKIITEAGAFPSDQYAVQSQIKFHGFSPEDALIELKPREGESILRTEDIIETIEKNADQTALILLGQPNYLTGQAFETAKIAHAARDNDCLFGLNLAHGAGNLLLRLHDWEVDFAVWCSYKYLNSGPGGLAACFVHEKHARSFELPRFAGWWGHNKVTRFKMDSQFDPLVGAEGWQLSNPPIFQLATLRASLEIFEEATMPVIRQKSEIITSYLEFLLQRIPDNMCRIITPSDPAQRGSQLSFTVHSPQKVLAALKKLGVICDFREPDIIRAAPAPLYVSYQDIYQFSHILESVAGIK